MVGGNGLQRVTKTVLGIELSCVLIVVSVRDSAQSQREPGPADPEFGFLGSRTVKINFCCLEPPSSY